MAKAKKDVPGHGGSRPGSGRKARFDEPTETIAFRLPASIIKALREKYPDDLNNQVYLLLKRHLTGFR